MSRPQDLLHCGHGKSMKEDCLVCKSVIERDDKLTKRVAALEWKNSLLQEAVDIAMENLDGRLGGWKDAHVKEVMFNVLNRKKP